jgi:hypothetical protein
MSSIFNDSQLLIWADVGLTDRGEGRKPKIFSDVCLVEGEVGELSERVLTIAYYLKF